MGSHDDDLIRIWIEDHPHRAGPADARVREYAVAVWAIVAYWQQAVGNDVEAVARDYRLPTEAVRAALAYYQRHRALINARIALNAA